MKFSRHQRKSDTTYSTKTNTSCNEQFFVNINDQIAQQQKFIKAMGQGNDQLLTELSDRTRYVEDLEQRHEAM